MFDLDLIESVYSNFGERVAAGRAKLGRPLTLSEKILIAHLDNPEDVGWKRLSSPSS